MNDSMIVGVVNPQKNCANCHNCKRVLSVADYACSHWDELLWNPEETTCYIADNSLNPDWQILFDEIYESQIKQAITHPAQATQTV